MIPVREMYPLAHMGIPMLPFAITGRKVEGWYLIFLGGLLPDLIDKPLGHLLLPENNGRIFAHTLLLCITLFTLGLVNSRAMLVAYGVAFHLLLDTMFMDPSTALWPLMGGFPTTDFELVRWFQILKDPEVIAYEVVGLACLAAYLVRTRRGRMHPRS
jgi:membrane-bound metal-dependent hydrolase YbcI (DUF457 family)